MTLRYWLDGMKFGKPSSRKRPARINHAACEAVDALEGRILMAADADLSLSQSVNAPNPGLGSTVTFTVTLSNAGPNLANSITISNPAPAGLTGVTFTPSTGSYNSGTGVWSPANLGSGGSATLTISGTVVTAGVDITNNAQVTGSAKSDPDSTPNNNNPAEDDQTSLTQHINYAPTLAVTGAAYLDAISVNMPSASNPGTLVSDIIARSGGFADADSGALQGLAINGAATTNGAWEFSTDGGSSWASIGAVTNDAARLLASDANTRVRFVPNTGFKGTAKFSFVAWDQTAGTNGGTGVTKFRTGVSPFSAGLDLASITVTNAAPVLDNSAAPTLTSIGVNTPSGSNPGTSIESLIAGTAGISDTDPGAVQGIAVNGVENTNGSWEYTVNGGTNWSPILTTGNSNATLLAADGNTRVRFVPNSNWAGSAKIAFVAWDRTSGANGGTANVTTRGGNTAYSLAYEYASITVANTAPVLTVNGASYLDSITNTILDGANVGTLVSDLIARSGGISDSDPGSVQGIAINGLSGTGTGTWQFSTDGGTTWTAVGTTGNSNARLLASTARVRYVPNTGFVGTVKIAFVAWDQTSGVNGGVASVGTRGGSTPYSSLYDYASLSVTEGEILS